MDADRIAETVRNLLARHREVHVLTSLYDQAEAVKSILSTAPLMSPESFRGEGPEFPPGPLVVCVGSNLCFHYIRAHIMEVAECTPVRERLAKAAAVLVGISERERSLCPCRVVDCGHPQADGTCELLGEMLLDELFAYYAEVVDLGVEFGEN